MSKSNDTVASRDEEAVRRLVADNLNLVRKEAHRQAAKWAGDEPAGVQEDLYLDLVQAGMGGLRRAADGFRPELGNKFSTYAMPWIRKTVGEEAGRRRARNDRAGGPEPLPRRSPRPCRVVPADAVRVPTFCSEYG